MQKIEYKQVQETIYYEQLPNGLSVYLLPKHGFHKAYATFTTRYGSIDNQFRINGEEIIQVPDGIAHFLEHKMFEQESGEDVFQAFARQGAAANAFTSFTRTAYLFSCTDQNQIAANINTLLDYVQSPYFTDENVEKEKGIIGQEIRMYDDNPDWRVFFDLLAAFYQEHPVKIDIAGTVESIQQITKETLYQCYETFYHPGNMSLFIVGAIQPEQILQVVRDNQSSKTFAPLPEIERHYPIETDQVAEKKRVNQLAVGIHKCMFGFKEPQVGLGKIGDAALKQELVTNIVLDALIGSDSTLYQSLYDEGLIDEQFGHEYSLEERFAFSVMGGDTTDPDRLLDYVKKEVNRLRETGIDQQTFIRIQKKKIGSALQKLNSPEWIAQRFTDYRFRGIDLFQITPLLEEIRLEEVNQRLLEHLNEDQLAVSIIKPKTN